MKSNLTEGLKIGDLEGLVLPLISIDEYESKISKDAIVVGFFVDDEEPANDLSRFIEKGHINVLDTDVSPAPDQYGYFMVFVEFIRDRDFYKKLMKIINMIDKLVDNKKWKFKAYGVGKIHELNLENLKKYVKVQENEQEKAKEKLKDSILDECQFEGNILQIGRNNSVETFLFEGCANFDDLVIRFDIVNNPLDLNEESLYNINRYKRMLGETWDIIKIKDYFLIKNINDNEYIAIKPIENNE